jgi:hypothetical protein
MHILGKRSDMPRTSSPFISAAEISEQKISSLGMSIVDLNEEIELEEWTKRRISELVYTDWVKITDPWFAENPIDPSPTLNFISSIGNKSPEEGDDVWDDDDDDDDDEGHD